MQAVERRGEYSKARAVTRLQAEYFDADHGAIAPVYRASWRERHCSALAQRHAEPAARRTHHEIAERELTAARRR